MNQKAENIQRDSQEKQNLLLRELDKGIDDMEAGREWSLDDAFQKITEMRNVSNDAI